MTEYNKGSEWRRWDLHYHTPSSFDVSETAITNDGIIENLLKRGIDVVAITDHHRIDVDRIRSLNDISSGRITILPGIEFRSELGGKASVHFIGIFPEYCIDNLIDLWTKISGKLSLTQSDISTNGGDEAIYVDFKETAKLIHELGGIVTVHAGSKSNSIEKIVHATSYQRQLKVDLISQCIDIFETSGANDAEDYKKIVFPKIGQEYPLITCSDSHHRSSDSKRFTWIKADPTFAGLKQVVFEPQERVRIQDNSPAREYEKSYFSKIYASGNIINGEAVSYKNTELPLNQNLIAIIGGRGTGKSLLLDCLLKSFNVHQTNASIDENRYSSIYPDNFESTFTKQDGVNIKSSLKNQQGISYLHVRQGEIQNVAQSPVELSNKIKELLRIDISDNYSENDLNIKEKLDKILEINNWLNWKNKNGQLTNKEEYCDRGIKYYKDLIKNVSSNQTQEAVSKYKVNQEEINNDSNVIAALNLKIKEVDEFYSSINEFINSMNNYHKLPTEKQLKTCDLSVISSALAKFKIEIENKKNVLSGHNEKIKSNLISTGINQDISTLLEKVEEYQQNLNGFEVHKDKIIDLRKELESSINNRNALIDDVKRELEQEVEKINKSFQDLKTGKLSWTQEQSELVNTILADINITAEITFDLDTFYEGISTLLNGSKFRTAGGIDKETRIRNMIGISSKEDFYLLCKGESVCNQAETKLTLDEICDQGDLFLSNVNYSLYDYIFLKQHYRKYLRVVPKLTYKGKSPEKLSVGQRGTFYLCLRLATDPFGSPFVFDQPEDDLDNEFITETLVPIFKEIKKYRQVIIATHNANLVVNADAEQVIIAKNENEKISFSSGALEDTNIKDDVCRILEGGKSAFMSRENKYDFKQ